MTDLFGTPIIKGFDGDHRFLSNFYPAPILYEGVSFPTTEHAFQWAKTLDPVEKEYILAAPTPGKAKARSREVTKRPDWDEVAPKVMLDVNRAKYTQNCGLRQLLEETGDAILVEGNTWHDNDWGTCTCRDCGDQGRNLLGLILMQIREELKRHKGVCFR